MVIKMKTSLAYKSRLCARGDLLKPEVPMEFSAPTVSRCAPKLILSVAAATHYRVGVVDISPAFTQSELVKPAEGIIIRVPPYVTLPWRGKVDTHRKDGENGKLGLLTLRPLYGTSCAPLRWFSAISAAFKRLKWRQLESDPCIF